MVPRKTSPANGVVGGLCWRRQRLLQAVRQGKIPDDRPPRPEISPQPSSSSSSSTTTTTGTFSFSSSQASTTSSSSSPSLRWLKCFPLTKDEVPVELQPTTPAEFHQRLCQGIRQAQHRVFLASLYLGPGQDSMPTSLSSRATSEPTTEPTASSSSSSVLGDGLGPEQELLDALQGAAQRFSLPVGPSPHGSHPGGLRILMDRQRALRPLSQSPPPPASPSHYADPNHAYHMTCCAEACYQALSSASTQPHDPHQVGIYLLSVLDPIWQRLLPPPWNEAAGVFHLKAYVMDDECIISGANLSQEYFVDRQDRYLWIRQPASIPSHSTSSSSSSTSPLPLPGGKQASPSTLVNLYADLIVALCEHAAEPYHSPRSHHTPPPRDPEVHSTHPRERRRRLYESLQEILTVPADGDPCWPPPPHPEEEHSMIVAWAVPTFQAPPHYFRGIFSSSCESTLFPMDQQAVGALLETAAILEKADEEEPAVLDVSAPGSLKPSWTMTVRMATAYLNLTDTMIRWLQPFRMVHLMTAGQISHGFKPKKGQKVGQGPPRLHRPSKDWIPLVFDELARQVAPWLQANTSFWFYHRPDWTFHAKGIWLSMHQQQDSVNNINAKPPDDVSLLFCHEVDQDDRGLEPSPKSRLHHHQLLAVTHGSSNWGHRSAFCDMESNVILIFPERKRNGSSSGSSGPQKALLGDCLIGAHEQEWNRLCEYAVPMAQEMEAFASRQLPWPMPWLFPWIRRFF